MKHEDLPARWHERLKRYLQEIDSKYDKLRADDFHHNLKIKFEDESEAFFYFAFYLTDENLKEAAVFTEHCGYHIFPLLETKYEMVDWQGNIIKTDDYRTE